MVREAFLQSRFGVRDARVQLLSRITECQVGDAAQLHLYHITECNLVYQELT